MKTDPRNSLSPSSGEHTRPGCRARRPAGRYQPGRRSFQATHRHTEGTENTEEDDKEMRFRPCRSLLETLCSLWLNRFSRVGMSRQRCGRVPAAERDDEDIAAATRDCYRALSDTCPP